MHNALTVCLLTAIVAFGSGAAKGGPLIWTIDSAELCYSQYSKLDFDFSNRIHSRH